MAGKYAVVLCGSGRADGSEIHESVSILIHLARHGATYSCFALDKPQTSVVNHATGKPEGGERNQLAESARISRGNIAPLSTLSAKDFDGVLFPGGFGAAKNLCTFAMEGGNCTVDGEVERVIREFHAARKSIGLCCIAPVLAARVLGTRHGGPGVKVTIGNDKGTADAIAGWGSTNVARLVTEACIDDTNKVVTTPAYMDDAATPFQVFEGIGRMVDGVVSLSR